MKCSIKTIYVALLIVCNASILSMTTLQKAKNIRRIPVKTIQTPPLIPTTPTEPLIITEPMIPSSSSPTTQKNLMLLKPSNKMKSFTIHPLSSAELQKWNLFKATLWNQWTHLKDKMWSFFFKPASTITPTEKIITPQPIIALPAIQPRPSLITKLDEAQSLQEAETILKNQEIMEQNKQQKSLNISPEAWQNLQKQIQEMANFLKKCFKTSNPNTTKDPNVPQQISERLDFFLHKAHINPQSISTRWQTINSTDSFGHDVILVTDPQGFIPATITLDPNKINTLSPEELDMHLIHAVTHLTEGDHTKLQLLQETVGTEKYAQYIYSSKGKKYLNALETNANFLWSIQDKNIAKIAQKDTFLTAFKLALNLIQNAQQNITDIKIDKITCPDLTGALSFLNSVTSFPEIEEYFANERKKILKDMHLNDDHINELEKKLLIQGNQINQYYKQKQDKEDHDPALPSHQLELTKKILKQTGIEPSSIIIKALLPYLGAPAGQVYFEESTNQNGDIVNIPVLALLINNDPEDLTIPFTIAHEVGHLLKHHLLEDKILVDSILLKEIWENANVPIRGTLIRQKEKLLSLWELEADAFAAMLYADIAQTNYNAMLQTGEKKGYYSKHHIWRNPGDPTYLETGERLNLYNKIVNLHNQA